MSQEDNKSMKPGAGTPAVQKTELSLEPSPEEKHQSSANASQMACPKCNRVQAKSPECAFCGIIIARYNARQEAPSSSGSSRKAREGSPRSASVTTFPWKLAGIAGAALLAFFMFFSPSGYKDIGSDALALAQINALGAAIRNPTADMDELRSLVEAGDYSEAEKIIRDLHNLAMEDILWEEAYQDTVDGISYKNNFSIDSLDQWIEASPSAISYLARGAYYVMEGNQVRGKRFASDTSDEQFSEQGRLHTLGVQDLQQALAMDASLFPAYTLLIMSSTSSGVSIPTEQYLQRAIDIAPGGYYFRYQYLRTLMPKWGGSFTAMETFTATVDNDVKHNPRLWLLKGFAIAEEAQSAYNQKNYKKAVGLYSDALQYGIHGGWLTKRAYSLSKIGEFGKAMDDLDLVSQYGYDDDYTHQLRNYVQSQL